MSENAVKNQFYLALITYCLTVLVQSETTSKKFFLQITRFGNKPGIGYDDLRKSKSNKGWLLIVIPAYLYKIAKWTALPQFGCIPFPS